MLVHFVGGVRDSVGGYDLHIGSHGFWFASQRAIRIREDVGTRRHARTHIKGYGIGQQCVGHAVVGLCARCNLCIRARLLDGYGGVAADLVVVLVARNAAKDGTARRNGHRVHVHGEQRVL